MTGFQKDNGNKIIAVLPLQGDSYLFCALAKERKPICVSSSLFAVN